MHIAQGLFKARVVNNLTKCGFTYIFWVADWFAWLNHKMNGDLEAIQTLGHYFIEIWKASGMDMSRVKFLWASKEFNAHADIYWPQVLDIATKNTLTRIKRCCTIMGRDDKNLSSSQILYPVMQASDIFFLGVDVCNLGLDQRKVNVLAREYAAETKQTPPVILSHPMWPALKKGAEKMSKSDPNSALFCEDTAEEIERKIKMAHCPPGGEMETVKIHDEETGKETEITRLAINPCLSYMKWIVLDGTLKVKVGEKYYIQYNELETDYHKGLITPQELKAALTISLNTLLQPIRNHFTNNSHAAKLLQEVKDLQARYAAPK
jgi:tyrosyl-tRNA synthetase